MPPSSNIKKQVLGGDRQGRSRALHPLYHTYVRRVKDPLQFFLVGGRRLLRQRSAGGVGTKWGEVCGLCRNHGRNRSV